ncbi:hypothetical protein GALMADRAFT_148551 [Galerina marginata CBS 339.88]|uniref:Uncharacterized protein n=1 Tax=Galerina marginata (strain CBS 339.88) TaxID=685588 RepID=A0A067SFV2_GALM3|nr:hypothetical protein GALMADRAFT_148551 [Galerina marginata CBS 339.88]
MANSPDKFTPQMAHYLARLAKETLKAEEDLHLSKLKECELTVVMLQEDIRDGRIHLKDAERQMQILVSHLGVQHLASSRNIQPFSPALSASALASYHSYLDKHLAHNWRNTLSMLSIPCESENILDDSSGSDSPGSSNGSDGSSSSGSSGSSKETDATSYYSALSS